MCNALSLCLIPPPPYKLTQSSSSSPTIFKPYPASSSLPSHSLHCILFVARIPPSMHPVSSRSTSPEMKLIGGGAALLLLVVSSFVAVHGFADGEWMSGSASCGSDASGTMDDGACGYGNLNSTGYGTNTAALSTALFGEGASCGQCYRITCDSNADPQSCLSGSPSVTVTATNLCRPDFNLPSDDGGWCNPPRQHFDMAQPAWEKIAIYRDGIIPISFQRVPCVRQGGVRFTINGFNDFQVELVLVTNVGGSGSVQSVWIKGSTTRWIRLSRNRGAIWECIYNLTGQSISFIVTTTDGQNLIFNNIAPANWVFGQTFTSSLQFS